MEFVFERVSEKDWKMYNSFKLSFNNRMLIANKYKCWTADKERNIYLILLGGGAFDSPEEYSLIWNNKKIHIFVYKEFVTSGLSESILHFRIENVIAPIELKQSKNELIEILNEAFACTVDCNCVIDFLAEPKFVN